MDYRTIAKDLADEVERLAFNMPAPNNYTPLFIQLVVAARQQIIRLDQENEIALDVEAESILRG